MSVNDLKCSECDEVTTDMCPECGTQPLCEKCKAAVKTCAVCDDEDVEEEGDEFGDDGGDDDDDDDEDEPVGWDDDDENEDEGAES
jgi:hypothetical protein